jgi:hypothetical protein
MSGPRWGRCLFARSKDLRQGKPAIAGSTNTGTMVLTTKEKDS